MYWEEVDKFGGSSLGNAESIERASDIILARKERRPIVVVSAWGTPVGTSLTKATNVLKGIEDALFRGDFEEAERLGKEFVERTGEIVAGLGLEDIVDYAFSPSTEREYIFSKLDRLFSEYIQFHEKGNLERIAGDLAFRNCLKDQFMALGEPLTAGLFAANLVRRGIPAKSIHPADIGLITDSNYQNANPLPGTIFKMREHLTRLQGRQSSAGDFWIPVIAGYVGKNTEDHETTLGRGASDYSAAILGHTAKVPVIIWTDVSGIYDGTPKFIANPKILPRISFHEALELATYGTTAIHPRAIEEARESAKPLYVKNTFNPEHPGTMIVIERKEVQGLVKAVTVLPEVAMVEAACSSSEYAEMLNYFEAVGLRMPISSYTEGRATIVLDTPQLGDSMLEKLSKMGLSGNRLNYSKRKFLIKIVGDGIGDPNNYESSMPILNTAFAAAKQLRQAHQKKTVYSMMIMHPSSIGIVASYNAGPAIAQAIHSAHL